MVPWQDEDHAHQISAALDNILKEANQKQPKDYRLQRWIEKMKRTGLKMDPVQRSSLPWMHNTALCFHDHMKMPLGVWLCSAQCEKVGFYEGGDLSPDGGEKPWGWHLLEVLLSMGMDTELKDPAGRTMLIAFAASIRCDFREAVSERLIKAGADVNAVDHEGFSALHYALQKQHYTHASYSLSCGAISSETINTQTRRLRHSPLMLACSGGDAKVVKELLRRGAHVHLEDESQRTALHYATKTENIKAIEALLASGADIEGNVIGAKRSGFARSAEKDEASDGQKTSGADKAHEEMTEPVVALWGASWDENGPSHWTSQSQALTPLLSAIRGQHYQSAKLLLEQGANASFSDGDYSTLEHLGMMLYWPQNNKIARELIESLWMGHQKRNAQIKKEGEPSEWRAELARELTKLVSDAARDKQIGSGPSGSSTEKEGKVELIEKGEAAKRSDRTELQAHHLLLLKVQAELQEEDDLRFPFKPLKMPQLKPSDAPKPSSVTAVIEAASQPTEPVKEWAWWQPEQLGKQDPTAEDERAEEISNSTSHLSSKRGRRVGL